MGFHLLGVVNEKGREEERQEDRPEEGREGRQERGEEGREREQIELSVLCGNRI